MTTSPTSAPTVALCLYKYFPHGGMQRAFRRIAGQLQDAGVSCTVYTLSWEGDRLPGIPTVIAPVHAPTNHQRYRRFHRWLRERFAARPVDCVFGFNKMPRLDVYYAADPCYAEKARSARSALYRLMPRYRHFMRCERAVFDPALSTRILMMSALQKTLFQKHYGTPDERFHMLPPGIARDRQTGPDAAERRHRCRSALGFDDDEPMLLLIGSGFITKGLDRAIDAVAALPRDLRRRTRLVAIGEDAPGRFRRHARRAGIDSRLHILPGRDDIPDFLQAADLLIHPAYFENTGNVLLEAMVAGLPVLTTDVCGFASYVEQAQAGEVLPSPFSQAALNERVAYMLTSARRDLWRTNGIEFGRSADIYSLPDRAAEVVLELIATRRGNDRQPSTTNRNSANPVNA